jgi:hypothetical protein
MRIPRQDATSETYHIRACVRVVSVATVDVPSDVTPNGVSAVKRKREGCLEPLGTLITDLDVLFQGQNPDDGSDSEPRESHERVETLHIFRIAELKYEGSNSTTSCITPVEPIF